MSLLRGHAICCSLPSPKVCVPTSQQAVMQMPCKSFPLDIMFIMFIYSPQTRRNRVVRWPVPTMVARCLMRSITAWASLQRWTPKPNQSPCCRSGVRCPMSTSHKSSTSLIHQLTGTPTWRVVPPSSGMQCRLRQAAENHQRELAEPPDGRCIGCK